MTESRRMVLVDGQAGISAVGAATQTGVVGGEGSVGSGWAGLWI